MTRAAIAGMMLFILSGCDTVQGPPLPPIVTEIPVPVSCIKDSAALAPPAFPDSDAALKAAATTFDRIKLMVAGRILRIAYELKLEAALSACK